MTTLRMIVGLILVAVVCLVVWYCCYKKKYLHSIWNAITHKTQEQEIVTAVRTTPMPFQSCVASAPMVPQQMTRPNLTVKSIERTTVRMPEPRCTQSAHQQTYSSVPIYPNVTVQDEGEEEAYL